MSDSVGMGEGENAEGESVTILVRQTDQKGKRGYGAKHSQTCQDVGSLDRLTFLDGAAYAFFVFSARFRSGKRVVQISQTVPSQPRAEQYSRP